MQNTEITINNNTNMLKIPGEMGGDVLTNRFNSENMCATAQELLQLDIQHKLW